MPDQPLKVALVHDYLREYGGAERVLEELHQLYPDAPVYVAFYDQKALGQHWSKFADWNLKTTWMAKIPLIKRFFSPLRILAPRAFASLDLTAFDVVISSTNAYFAKCIQVRPDARHLCYCHTPSRSLYGYTTMMDWKANPVTRVVGNLMNHYLRVIDVKAAQQVTEFIANSRTVQQRIKKFYRRDAVIIYPPVKIPKSAPSEEKRVYYLFASRLAFSKHPEMAVAACTDLKLTLKVAGEGKMISRLHEIAGPTIEFMGGVSDAELSDLYANATALLYPAEEEDFGMVPIEAMGHGVPVLAHESGGPTETIEDGKTGILFPQLSTDAVKAAIKKSQKMKFDRQHIWKVAQKYSQQKFDEALTKLVQAK